MPLAPAAKYFKDPTERKRYKLDYSQWLDRGETIAAVEVTVKTNTTEPLVITDVQVMPEGVQAQYYVGGGQDEAQYELLIKATTSGAQIKEDVVLFVVREN